MQVPFLVVRWLLTSVWFIFLFKNMVTPDSKAMERYKNSVWCTDTNGGFLRYVKIILSFLLVILPIFILHIFLIEDGGICKWFVDDTIFLSSEIVPDISNAVDLCLAATLLMTLDFPFILPARLWLFGAFEFLGSKKKGKTAFLKGALAVVIAVELAVLPILSFFLSNRIEKDALVITDGENLATRIEFTDATLQTSYGFSPEDEYFFVYVDLYGKNGEKIDLITLCKEDYELLLRIYHKMEDCGAKIEKSKINATDYQTAKRISEEAADALIDEIFEVVK